MKRALPAVPLVLFIFLNACVNGMVIDGPVQTAVKQTEIASSFTPTYTPTLVNFDALSIVNWLNSPLPEDGLLQKVGELEDTIGGSYHVVDVRVEPKENQPNKIFEVEVSCHCSAPYPCCSSERSFAIIMRNMDVYRDDIMSKVPNTVDELHVYCMDHDKEVGVVAATWSDVSEYLGGQINGYQFGSRVWRE